MKKRSSTAYQPQLFTGLAEESAVELRHIKLLLEGYLQREKTGNLNEHEIKLLREIKNLCKN